MGAHSEQIINEKEITEADFQNSQEAQESNPRYELIGKLMRKELRLSYSKLKHLTSPVNFLEAILNPSKRNSGMSLGSVVDCLLLTEELFDEQFTIVSDTPTTDKQEEFVSLVKSKMLLEPFSMELLEAKFKETVSEGFSRVKTDGLIDYIAAVLQGKECISQDMYEKAKGIVENLRNADEVADELAVMDSFQKKLEFNYKGWNFICFLDTFFEGGFDDLKFASDCSPDKYPRDLEKFAYDIQIGVYALGFEQLYGNFNPTVKHIVYDAIGNYAVYNIDSAYVNWCKRKVDFLINCLDNMIEKKAFNKSYSFFKPNLTIYKPRWAQGFDETIFQ